jgi:hypothetical protein
MVMIIGNWEYLKNFIMNPCLRKMLVAMRRGPLSDFHADRGFTNPVTVASDNFHTAWYVNIIPFSMIVKTKNS